MHSISAVFGHRRELFATTLHELKGKYAATVLGFVWPVVFPLLFLSAYALVFLYVFKVKPADLTSKSIYLSYLPGWSHSLALARRFPTALPVLSKTRGW